MSQWRPVIGLEVHARLLTRSKIFCGCATDFGAPPNTQVCPVCLGYPGALPVLNRRALELALRMAIATDCTIHHDSIFARKNYFYPDLPKGYQISQFDRPLATGGRVTFRTAAGEKTVSLRRIHMEEDAGKLLHDIPFDDVPKNVSLVDLNRAGTPLIEIVSEPEIHSADEAVAYFTRLRQILMYTDVCEGNMEEGALRCDANVSVHSEGMPLGTRSEIKNLNSFRFLRSAIEYEIERQIGVLESGGAVVQETRLYDPGAGETRSMRSKEEAHDYRYFPEPDLLSVTADEHWVEQIRSDVPELPGPRAARYHSEWGVPIADAEVLVSTRALADYFEETATLSKEPRLAANWVRNEVLRIVNDLKIDLDEYRLRPPQLAQLIQLVSSGAIGGKTAKEVFEEISTTGGDPGEVVRRRGLTQVTDPGAIREAAEKVLAANATQVTQYRSGKTAVFGFLVGQLMKETRGKAKADVANQVLRELLDKAS